MRVSKTQRGIMLEHKNIPPLSKTAKKEKSKRARRNKGIILVYPQAVKPVNRKKNRDARRPRPVPKLGVYRPQARTSHRAKPEYIGL